MAKESPQVKVINPLLIEKKSLVHSAVIAGNFKRISFLLKNGADINARNKKGKTCLQIAVEKGFFNMIHFLLDHKASVNSVFTSAMRDGYTPLHFAAEKRNSLIVRLLLDYGADIHARTNGNLQPIHIAIKRGQTAVIKVLLDNGADINARFDNGDSILYSIVDSGNIEILLCILQYKLDLNDWNNKRAINAGIYGFCNYHKRLVKLLYEYGFTLNDEEYSNQDLIFHAVRKGNYLAVKDLLDHGVDPNLQYFPSPSHMRQKASLLHFAVDYEWMNIVQLLLEYGANIHIRDAMEKTPLLTAAERNNLAILKMLIKRGANILDVDMYNRTVLHLVVLQKIRYTNKAGTEWIWYNTKYKLVKWLLENGADINAQTNSNGSTCLHIAAFQGYVDVIMLLLEYDADINIVNHRNITALEYALECMYSHPERRNYSATNFHRYRYYNFCVEARVCSYRYFQQHVHRMHRMGLFVDEKNLTANTKFYQLTRYFKEVALEEIRQLQKTLIGDSITSYYTFLMKSPENAAVLVMNDDIVKGLREVRLHKKKFPGFMILIKNRLRLALARKKADVNFFKLVKFFLEQKESLPYLPNECVYNIISNFTQNEMDTVYGYFVKKKE